MSRLHLVCTFEPAVGAAAGSSEEASSGGGGAFQAREEAITLRPGERVICHLRVLPLRPGRLALEGVAWTLNGTVQGQRAFRVPRPRPCKPGSSMCAAAATAAACVGVACMQARPKLPPGLQCCAGAHPCGIRAPLVQDSHRRRAPAARQHRFQGSAAHAAPRGRADGAGTHAASGRGGALHAAAAECRGHAPAGPQHGSGQRGGVPGQRPWQQRRRRRRRRWRGWQQRWPVIAAGGGRWHGGHIAAAGRRAGVPPPSGAAAGRGGGAGVGGVVQASGI